MKVEERTLTREELYNELWTTPARILAEKLGTTDVGLGKLCRRHGIPKPGLGYWAKKAAGKKVKQVPLPPAKDSHHDEFCFQKHVYTPEELEQHRRPCRIAPEAEKLLAAEKHAAPIALAADLRGCHRVVSKMAQRANGFHWPKPGPNGEKPRWSQSSSGPFGIRSGEDQVRRALLIFDAILKALEARGQKVTSQPKEWRYEPILTVLGSEFTLSVYEPCRQVDYVRQAGDANWMRRRWDFIPTGELCFRLYTKGSNRESALWRDSKNCRLESLLNRIVKDIIWQAGREKVLWEERAEAERRQWEEAEKRRKAEERRRQEQERINDLVGEAEAWRQATTVRDYLEAVRTAWRKGRLTAEAESDLSEWLSWADAVAQRLLPARLAKLKAADDRARAEQPQIESGTEDAQPG